MKGLAIKWGKFFGVVLSPGTVIFTLLTIGSLVLSYWFRIEIKLSTLLAILGSFLAGIAGSFIRDDYSKLVGENILEKKG